MTTTAFDKCFARLIGHEGGFTKDSRDKGNWTGGAVNVGQLKGTKFGLSAMTYPDLDIENLTLMKAREIYFRDWWLKAGANYLNSDMVYQMWQFAINAGMGNARRVLQRAVGVVDDGDIGAVTIEAIKKMDAKDIPLLFFKYMIKHYTATSTWATYGKGWMNRTADAIGYSAEDN